MNEPDDVKKVLLVDHIEGQCRAIIGFKDEDPRAAFMCGEPVYQRPGRKPSSWCAYHHRQMHASAVEQSRAGDRVPEISQAISIVPTP